MRSFAFRTRSLLSANAGFASYFSGRVISTTRLDDGADRDRLRRPRSQRLGNRPRRRARRPHRSRWSSSCWSAASSPIASRGRSSCRCPTFSVRGDPGRGGGPPADRHRGDLDDRRARGAQRHRRRRSPSRRCRASSRRSSRAATSSRPTRCSSFSRNGLAILGPAIGALLVVTFGSGWAIAIDAAHLGGGRRLHGPGQAAGGARPGVRTAAPSMWRDLRDGWSAFTSMHLGLGRRASRSAFLTRSRSVPGSRWGRSIAKDTIGIAAGAGCSVPRRRGCW